jgi:hypothetical protein
VRLGFLLPLLIIYFGLPSDFADQLVQDILIQYEQIYNLDKSDVIIKSEDGEQRKDTTIPEVWSSTQVVQLFTFLISIYRLVSVSMIHYSFLFIQSLNLTS